MEKVIRFYSPWSENSIYQLRDQDFVSSEGVTSIEICLFPNKPYTFSYTIDASSGKIVEKKEIGWRELDPEKEYHFVAEALWYDSTAEPWDGIKLTNKMRYPRLPVDIFESMKSENVKTVGLCDCWGDGIALRNAVDELQRMGFDKVYKFGKYYNKDLVDRYAELCQDHPGTVKGPKIKLKEKEKPKKAQETKPEQQKPEQPKVEEKKVSGVVAGDYRYLNGDVLTIIRSKYEGCVILVTKVKGDLKILIKDFQGPTSSQK